MRLVVETYGGKRGIGRAFYYTTEVWEGSLQTVVDAATCYLRLEGPIRLAVDSDGKVQAAGRSPCKNETAVARAQATRASR